MNQEKDPQISAPEENTSAAENENTEPENEQPEAAETEAAAKEDGPTSELKPIKKKNPTFFQSEKFKHGTTATAFTAIFIVVVVLVNILFGILSNKFPSINFDVTKTGSNSLSTESLAVIDKVKTPVEITICASKEACESNSISANGGSVDYAQVSRLFSKAAERNSSISLSYVDLDKNPTFAATYKTDNVQAGDIVVKSDKRHRVLTSSDLFKTSYSSDYSSTTTTSNVDSALASALNSVTAENMPVASFDTGHSEQLPSDSYKHLLQNSSFETKDFSLLAEKIPEKTQLLVLGCPTSDLTEEEVQKIDDWLHDKTLKMDRTLLVTTTAGATSLDKLNGLLNEWGLSADTSAAVEETDSTKYLQSPLNIYADVDTSLSLGGKNSTYSSVLATNIAPVTIKATSVGNKTTHALLKTSEKSVVLKSSGSTTTTSDPAAQNVAALSQQTINIDKKDYNSNVILCGSTTIFNSQVLESSVFGNGTYLGDLSRYATGTNNSSSVIETTSKEMYAKDISVTSQTVLILGYGVFTILIPLAVMIAGIIVHRKRRAL